MTNNTTNVPTQEIPYGYCHCGCGQKTKICNHTDTKYGLKKGEPHHYIRGHHSRKPISPAIAKLCECGCGQETKIAQQSNTRLGWIKGQPIRYITGHNKPSQKQQCEPWYESDIQAPWVAKQGLRHPYGECQCGCGNAAPLAGKSSADVGNLAGHPLRCIRGHAHRLPPEEHFWRNVDRRAPGECWLWTGSTYGRGYGKMTQDYATIRAHRFSYELHHGPIPDGLFVLHKCDNPPCVNPDHLFLGTTLDNTQDMIRKGRNRPVLGESNFHAKLTNDQVLSIRHKFEAGEPAYRLAIEYNISQSSISGIVNHKTWRHLP